MKRIAWGRRVGGAATLSLLCAGCTLTSPLDHLQDGEGGQGGGADAGWTGHAASSGADDFGPASSSSATGGSGGAGGAALGCTPMEMQAVTGLVMNEIAPDGVPKDWIEIENRTGAAILLCGFRLTEDYDGATVPSDPTKVYTFDDRVLAPGAYLVLSEEDTAGGDFPFGISKLVPERITLFDPLGQVVDDVEIPASELPIDQAHSWGRAPDGTGAWMKLGPPTPGATN